MTKSNRVGSSCWWGEVRLEEEELGLWRIGPLEMWVRRTGVDWRYGWRRSDDPLDSRLEVHVPWDAGAAELPEELARVGVARTRAVLALAPALADRPVVTRPAVPFFVPTGQRVELFVSTPLWIQLRSGKSDLGEVACLRPSDTWFGTNTRGELCYASRTHLRRKLDNVAVRPHRATSCLTVENVAEENLSLERLCLPMPQLSLFAGPGGSLWTEHISVRNEKDGDLSEVSLGQGPPRVAGSAERVADARVPRGQSFGSLVFGGLFETGP